MLKDRYINTSVDSCKFRIDEMKVQFSKKGQKLLKDAKFLIDLETGEIEELDKKTQMIQIKEFKELGINLYVGASKGDLVLFLTSKLLKENYFKGITEETLRQIYNEIMKLDLFKFEYKEMLTNILTDADVKVDTIINESYKEFFGKIQKATKDWAKPKLSKKNTGIQWHYRRKDTQIKGKPYIKIYSKNIELMHNSKEFYNNYLKGQFNNYTRFETTIKNKDHWHSILKELKLPACDLTFENIFKLTESQKVGIIMNMFRRYKITKRKYDLVGDDMKTLTPAEKVVYKSLKDHLLLGKTYYHYLEDFKQGLKKGAYYLFESRAIKVYELLQFDNDVKDIVTTSDLIDDLLYSEIA